MADRVDYRMLGFRAGLEIHQQLATQKKLFCRCPVGLNNAEPDARIIRHMRPTLSELGEYDGTALMEFKTRKTVVYELLRKSMCTYEMDDTPPFRINSRAVDIAIEIALLLNCCTVDEIHISRKQYLDGSIPTGFQRTAVVGVGGSIPFRGRKIRIRQVNVEEDSCREESDKGHTIVWRTDRLSTPLVEVITEPDLETPEEVSAVNALIGRVLRSTGKVRRGAGSARQDINVSIEGGTRMEIKGVPKTRLGEMLTATEALRQKSLLGLRDSLLRRGITSESFASETADVSGLFRGSGPPLLSDRVGSGDRVGAVRLAGWSGLLHTTTQPGRVFAHELAGRVRVIACLDGKPNILHSDEPLVCGMTGGDWGRLAKALGAGEGDALVVTWGSERDVTTACEEIRDRAREATIGVPRETRQALHGGITRFERILPGPDRMYPDTDSPPQAVTSERIERIASRLPGRLWLREERYRSLGLTRSEAEQMSLSPWADRFDQITEEGSLPPRRAAAIILGRRKALRRDGVEVERIPPFALAGSLRLLSRGEVTWPGFLQLLKCYACGERRDPESIVEAQRIGTASRRESDKIAEKVVGEWDGLPEGDREAAIRRLTGAAVSLLGARGDGKALREKISFLLK